MNLIFLSFVDFLKSTGNFIIDLLIFSVVLGVIVGIHELGHFLFARRANVLCREYAIGMGPKLWKKRKGETIYSLRLFPIGGFCAIAGEEVEADPFKDLKQIKLKIVDGVIVSFYPEIDDDSFDFPVYDIISYDIYDENNTGNLYMEVSKDGVVSKFKVDSKAIIYTKKAEWQIAPYNRTLGSKTKTQRALVMFGGPLMNFVLAITVFFICGLFLCFNDYSQNKINDVTMGDISKEYTKIYSFDDLNTLDKNSVTGIYTSSITKYKDSNDIDSFISLYEKTDKKENIYVVLERDNYLQKGDVIIKLASPSLSEKDIKDFNDINDFLNEYNKKCLSEKVTITYKRGEETKTIESLPFISINNIGIGSGWYYDENKCVIKAYSDDFTSSSRGLGDNSQLQLNDVITSVNGIINPSWKDLREVFQNYVGDSDTEEENWITMTVKRISDGEEKEYEVKVKPYSKKLMEGQTALDGEKPMITVATFDLEPVKKFSIIKSVGYAFTRTWTSFTSVIETLKLLFTGSVSVKNLSGPIGIFSITSSARSAGFTYILSLIGFLSVNIGFLNLFPIPALDGGRLVFVAYEAVTKKKPNPKVETILITVTMILLLALMLFVAFQDTLSFIIK